MNVKFVRVKVTKSEFFSFFFLFRKFFDILPKKETRLDKRRMWCKKEGKGKKKKTQRREERSCAKKKESILLVGLLRIFVLVIVTDFTCRG